MEGMDGMDDEIEEYLSSQLEAMARFKKPPKKRAISMRMKQVMAHERKEAAIKCFRRVCERTHAGPGAFTASDWGPNSRDKLLAHVDTIQYSDSCQKIFGHIAEHGTITQVSL
jgi:hypothetical protein